MYKKTLMTFLAGLIALLVFTSSAQAKFSLTPDDSNNITASDKASNNADNLNSTSSANPEVLGIDSAFEFNYKESKDALTLIFKVKPGYYLYQNRFAVTIDNGTQTAGLSIPLTLPKGKIKHDPYIGDYEALSNEVKIDIPYALIFIKEKNTDSVNLKVSYQGCSEKGFCYPKAEKLVSVSYHPHMVHFELKTNTEHKADAQPETKTQTHFLFDNRSAFIVLGLFFLSGILLAFTPCILPMIPILSGIILGQKHKLSTSRAFEISLTYTVGMAFAYALIGFLAAGLGQHLQTQMQRPEVTIAVALLFMTLGLIEYKVFHFTLPLSSTLNAKIQALSNRIPRGTFKGAFMMGILATLVASPCVSVPMVGAIAYLADTGDILLGGSSLFMLGLGMGAPLILASTLGVNYLPHKGIWMERVNLFIGFIFLGLSLWLFERVYPGPHIYILAAILCLITSIEFYKGKWLSKLIALFIVLAGVSFALNVINPNLVINLKDNHQVASVESLNQVLRQHQGKNIILDYSANWCTSCLQMEKEILQHPDAQASLKDWTLVKVDVSEVNDTTKALYDRYNLIAPPVLIFLDKDGNEIPNSRKVGSINLGEFLEHLKKIKP